MPARKADVKIHIEAYGKSFNLNCVEGLFDHYKIKNGRSVSAKMPNGTITEIYDLAREWTVKQKNIMKNKGIYG